MATFWMARTPLCQDFRRFDSIGKREAQSRGYRRCSIWCVSERPPLPAVDHGAHFSRRASANMPDRVLTSGMHDGSGQSSDPLLTDHLATLLRQFPNGDRHKIVAVLREHTSWSPFSASRAAAAHAVKPGGDLCPHVDAIASEILWWGSNEFHRMFGEERTWPDVLSDTAKSMGVSSDDCVAASGACGIERALLKKAFEHWESLKPEQREEALRKAGINLDPARGGVGAAFGAAGMAAHGRP